MINPIRILIGVMLISLFNLTTAFADITIDSNTIHVETNNYKVQFDRGVITQLHNKLTDETYTLPPDSNINGGIRGGTTILIRDRFVWTWHGNTVETRKINSHQAEFLFRDGGSEIKVVIAVDPLTDDLLISGDCASDRPEVYGMQLGIGNLDLNTLSLILPSHGGRIIDATDAIEHENFDYLSPNWEVQLAIIQAALGGFYVRGTDTTFQSKVLHYQSDDGEFGLGFRTLNQAPWDGQTSAKSVPWRLNTYVGDWCAPAQIYRDWMEEAFDPWRLSNTPVWVRDIGLVVTHTGLDIGLLERLAGLVDPTKTLLYLTEWRKDPHPINYPDYTPNERCDDFLKVAHQLGFRVMLHASLHDISPNHPLYPEFKKYQYRHPYNGELTGWLWEEIDNPQRNAHINPASSQWRNLIVQRLKAVWEKYNIDAFHLDTSHFVLNDANGLIEGLTGAQGNVLIHEELAQAMPGCRFWR